MGDLIYLPFDKNLYDDVVRFSNGHCDLVTIMEEQFHNFIRRTADDHCFGVMGDDPERLRQFLAIYHPDIVARWEAEEAETHRASMVNDNRWSPLVWKEVTVPAGSFVRMQYGGAYHHARVETGKIVDVDGQYSPSEWASKVAAGTNRNAWRDLYFRLPGKADWVAASALRSQRQKETRALNQAEIDELLKDL
jgi:hypothetical protein